MTGISCGGGGGGGGGSDLYVGAHQVRGSDCLCIPSYSSFSCMSTTTMGWVMQAGYRLHPTKGTWFRATKDLDKYPKCLVYPLPLPGER